MEIHDAVEGSIKSENDSQYSQLIFDDALDTHNVVNSIPSNCIECSACNSEFLLSCLHPICLKCFPKVIKLDNTFHCKLCDSQKENICWNWQVKEVSKCCKFCLSIPDYDSALFYCLQCFSLVCSSCKMVHNNRFHNHKLLSLNNVVQFCCKHPDKYMEWFCKDCDHTICENCQLDNEHDDHNVIWAQDWVKKSLDGQTLTPLCYYKYSTLEEASRNRLPDAIDVLDKECEMVERDVHSARLAVSQTVKKLIDLLRGYNDRINSELDSYQNTKIASLQSTKKSLYNTKQKSDVLVNYIKNLSYSVSVKEALSVVNFFTNHTEEIRGEFSLAEEIIQSYIERQAAHDDPQMETALWKESQDLDAIVKSIGTVNYKSKLRPPFVSDANLNSKRNSPLKRTPMKEKLKKKPSPSKDELPSIKIKIPKDVQEAAPSSTNSTPPPVQSSSSFDEDNSSSNSNEKLYQRKKPPKRRRHKSKSRKSKLKISKLESPQDSCDEFVYSLYKKNDESEKSKNNVDSRHCLIGSPFTTESVSEPTSPNAVNLLAPDHAADDPHEDYCSVCFDGGELVCCSRCVHVYHAQCHLPHVGQALLEDDWVCIMCTDLQPLNSDENQTTSGSLSSVEYMIACKCLMAMYFDKVNSLPFVTTINLDEVSGRQYDAIIKRPMSLSTLSVNLADQLYYSGLSAFICDVELMFNNCYKYNGPKSSFGHKATALKNVFYETLKQYTTNQS